MRRFLTRFLLALLIAAAAGAMLVYAIRIFGRVSGEEFAPDTFERRIYWYYELPLVRWKITPIFRRVEPTQLEKMLVSKKYVVAKSPPERWDLVAAHRAGKPWRQGDAQILCHYLDAFDPENKFISFWETWTTDHPKLAKVLWPKIATLARQDLYYLIPQLFELSLEHVEPQPFQEHLDRTLAHQYEFVAATEVELGNLETAIRLYSESLTHQPGRINSLQGRASCYEMLGETDKAARDRDMLERQALEKAEKQGS